MSLHALFSMFILILDPKQSHFNSTGNRRKSCFCCSEVGPPMEGTHKWHSAVLAPDGCYLTACDGNDFWGVVILNVGLWEK